MAKFGLSELMTKIGYVFKMDSYLIDNQYIIGGESSEKENPSNILLVLSPQHIETIQNEIKEKFENYEESSILHFLDVKNGKKDLYINTKVINKNADLMEIINYTKSIIDQITDWDTFQYNLEQIEEFITEGRKITMFEDNEDIPEVSITKKVIPLLSLKNFNDLRYKAIPAKNNTDLNALVFRLDTEWFQIYSIVEYLSVN